MPELRLAGIYRYPVKSLSGQSASVLPVDQRGLQFDRQWMLVDAEGRFLTQRQRPRMALIRTHVDTDGRLLLQAPAMPDLAVSGPEDDRITVSVWSDSVAAAPSAPAVDAWFSAFLDTPCRLVRMPDSVHRPVDPAYARPGDQVGFADGFPFLLISQASLDDLNKRLEAPVSILRFRPNLLVEGCAAFAEDAWRRIRIGGLTFRVAKPCSRCTIPNVDLDTGERGREPMQTLTGYRRRDGKVYFGQNLIHDGTGEIAVGMPVELLE